MNENINELKVINETINESKVFKSVEEFNLFYQKNIEQMKTQTTNYLNKIYKFNTNDGNEYKITKRNCKDGKRCDGDIYLKKVGNTITKTLENDNIKADINMLRETVNAISTKTDAIDELRDLFDSKLIHVDIIIKQLIDKNKILEEHINKLSNVVDQQSKVINEYVLNVVAPDNHRMIK